MSQAKWEFLRSPGPRGGVAVWLDIEEGIGASPVILCVAEHLWVKLSLGMGVLGAIFLIKNTVSCSVECLCECTGKYEKLCSHSQKIKIY